MLYFRDYRWLRVNGASRFSVYIPSGARDRSQIRWWLVLHYIAGGAAWRRVPSTNRPWFWMDLHGFTAPATSWRDLEQVNFRNREEEDDPYVVVRGCGSLGANLYLQNEAQESETIPIWDYEWRVAARDGRWFTVELAALCDSQRSFADLAKEQPAAVTADGEVVADEQSAESELWKEKSDLYLLEQVPFGTVTVRTPRNARDPFRYAFARAQEFIGGLPEPFHSEILRFGEPRPDNLSLHDDLHVELHFFGYYED